MAKKNDLYTLIHSLSSNEKRAFTRQSPPSNYLTLFKLYQQMDDGYDEDFLLQQWTLAVDKNVDKNLRNTQDQLFKKLLQKMRQINEEGSVNQIVLHWLEEARILRGRKLYEAGEKRLRSARKKAVKYQRWSLLLDIHRLERTILKERQTRGYEQKVKEIWKWEDQIREHLAVEGGIWKAYDGLLILTRKGGELPEAQVREEAQALLQQSCLQDKLIPKGFEARQGFHSARALGQKLLHESTQARKEFRAIVDWFEDENHAHFKKEKPDTYLLVINNYLNLCLQSGYFEDFDLYLAKVQRLKMETEDLKAEQFQVFAFLRLGYLMNQHPTAEAMKFIPTVEKGLQRFSDKINPASYLAFAWNIVAITWLHGDLDQSVRWIRNIRQFDRRKIREDIQRMALVIRCFLGYGLGEQDWADPLPDLQKQFRKIKTPQIRRVLRRMQKMAEGKISRSFWVDWQAELRAESPFLGQDEILEWLKQQIN